MQIVHGMIRAKDSLNSSCIEVLSMCDEGVVKLASKKKKKRNNNEIHGDICKLFTISKKSSFLQCSFVSIIYI